jgi:hypothetical protein
LAFKLGTLGLGSLVDLDILGGDGILVKSSHVSRI